MNIKATYYKIHVSVEHFYFPLFSLIPIFNHNVGLRCGVVVVVVVCDTVPTLGILCMYMCKVPDTRLGTKQMFSKQ